MAIKITLPKGSILEIESPVGTWNKITEHNREPLEESNERIEDVKRMANGTLRKYYVADKKTFSTSWQFVPGAQTYLVDTAWSVDSLKTFYASDLGKASFKIRIKKADGTYNGPYTVIFSQFESTIVKRGVDTFYNLSIEMTEV
jgi:hypothetical protein